MRRVPAGAHHQLLLPGPQALLQAGLPTVRARGAAGVPPGRPGPARGARRALGVFPIGRTPCPAERGGSAPGSRLRAAATASGDPGAGCAAGTNGTEDTEPWRPTPAGRCHPPRARRGPVPCGAVGGHGDGAAGPVRAAQAAPRSEPARGSLRPAASPEPPPPAAPEPLREARGQPRRRSAQLNGWCRCSAAAPGARRGRRSAAAGRHGGTAVGRGGARPRARSSGGRSRWGPELGRGPGPAVARTLSYSGFIPKCQALSGAAPAASRPRAGMEPGPAPGRPPLQKPTSCLSPKLRILFVPGGG